ncbi:MAG: adenylate kinase [Candidatus Hadarchaeales archaeon]
MSRVAVITGVPGSGKSTVVGRALEELRKEGIEYTVVNYGDVMLELMREKEGITHRDDMRKVPTQRYREIQREAGRRIAQVAKEKNVLVDTHCLVKKPEGYYPGLPIWVLEELKPDLLLIVEAAPEEITRRRVKDADRKRDAEVQLEIEEHQLLNRATAMAYAALTGAAVKIIQNRDGKLNEAVEEMVSVLR